MAIVYFIKKLASYRILVSDNDDKMEKEQVKINFFGVANFK